MDVRTDMRMVSMAVLIVLAAVATALVNLQVLVITLIVAMAIVFASAIPQKNAQPVRIRAEEPPARPEDTRGGNFNI